MEWRERGKWVMGRTTVVPACESTKALASGASEHAHSQASEPRADVVEAALYGAKRVDVEVKRVRPLRLAHVQEAPLVRPHLTAQ